MHSQEAEEVEFMLHCNYFSTLCSIHSTKDIQRIRTNDKISKNVQEKPPKVKAADLSVWSDTPLYAAAWTLDRISPETACVFVGLSQYWPVCSVTSSILFSVFFIYLLFFIYITFAWHNQWDSEPLFWLMSFRHGVGWHKCLKKDHEVLKCLAYNMKLVLLVWSALDEQNLPVSLGRPHVPSGSGRCKIWQPHTPETCTLAVSEFRGWVLHSEHL